METTTTTPAGSPLFELQIDHNGSAHLTETAKWARFLAIVGFIFIGLMVLFGLFAGTIMATMFRTMSGMSGYEGYNGAAGMFGGIFSFFYIAIALVYFFPTLYLYNFATKMLVALRNNDQELLGNSFKNLKASFRFVGILMIIGLGLWALIILFALLGAAFSH